MDGTCRYIFKTNNPIVLVASRDKALYVVIGPGGYLAYMKFGFYDHMPNAYVSQAHLYPSFLLAAFCFYCYYQAVNVDPGVITKANVHLYLQKYDQFDGCMFEKNNECPTCKIKK